MNAKTKMVIGFIGVILGYAIVSIDTTIVNIALPQIASYYNVQMNIATWVINVYNIAFAVFIVTASGLADQFGRKKVFLIGYILFTVSSICVALSNTFELMILFRAIQGLSGAITVPVAIPIFTTIFPKEKHGAVIGLGGGIAGLAVAAGPTVGGIITQNLSWQWIFLINIPIGIIGIVLTLLAIPESFDSSASKKIDIGGIISISIGMFAITYAITQVNTWGWTSWSFIACLLISIIAFVVFGIIEKKIKEPMLPLWLMKISTFNCANLTFLFSGAGITGTIFLISFYLTTAIGMSPADAGLILSVLPLITCFISPVAGAWSNKIGSRWFAVGGIFFTSIGLLLYSGITTHSSYIDIIWRLLVSGIGLGLTTAPILQSVMRNVPPGKIGIASGITNMARFFGAALGVAVFVTILNSNLGTQNDIGSLQTAFGTTFKIASCILVPGIFIAYFSDK